MNELQTTLAENVRLRREMERLATNLEDCRNELCLYCGKYKERHIGACDACRWKERGNG